MIPCSSRFHQRRSSVGASGLCCRLQATGASCLFGGADVPSTGSWIPDQSRAAICVVVIVWRVRRVRAAPFSHNNFPSFFFLSCPWPGILCEQTNQPSLLLLPRFNPTSHLPQNSSPSKSAAQVRTRQVLFAPCLPSIIVATCDETHLPPKISQTTTTFPQDQSRKESRVTWSREAELLPTYTYVRKNVASLSVGFFRGPLLVSSH